MSQKEGAVSPDSFFQRDPNQLLVAPLTARGVSLAMPPKFKPIFSLREALLVALSMSLLWRSS